MKATERQAEVAVVAVGRVDIGEIEDEVERGSSPARATRPVAARVAGVVQVLIASSVSINIAATDKESKIVQLNDLDWTLTEVSRFLNRHMCRFSQNRFYND